MAGEGGGLSFAVMVVWVVTVMEWSPLTEQQPKKNQVPSQPRKQERKLRKFRNQKWVRAESGFRLGFAWEGRGRVFQDLDELLGCFVCTSRRWSSRDEELKEQDDGDDDDDRVGERGRLDRTARFGLFVGC